MKNIDYVNKSIIMQSSYSDASTYVNKQNAMDYLHQFYEETSENFGSNNDENMSKISSYRHHQSQNNKVYLSNPMPSFNLKQCSKCGFYCESMNQILEHIHNCHQTTTALCNVLSDHNYSMMPECEIIKIETEILDLNSYEVQDLDEEENIIQHQSKHITHRSNQGNENDNHPIFILKEENENPDGNHTINEETNIIETKRFAKIDDVAEVIKTETKILDLNSYEVGVLHVVENVVHFETNQIIQNSNLTNENEYPMFTPKEEKQEPDEEEPESKQRINEHLSSAKTIWKSNIVRKSTINNCATCNKSFVTPGYLRTHYKSKLHKHSVKRSGLPDPAILPINSHQHSNDTYKERIIQVHPKKIIHQSNENDNCPMFTPKEEKQPDGIVNDITTINEETDIIETKRSVMIALADSTSTDGDIVPITSTSNTDIASELKYNALSSSPLTSNNTPDVGEITKTETEILDLNSYEVQVLGVEENIRHFKTNQIIHKSNQPIENDNHPKINNCTTCNKSFVTSGYLRTHYKSKLHKYSVKRSGLPDPANLPINSHHHANATYKERIIQFHPKQIIHQSNLPNENDNYPMFTPKEEIQEPDEISTSNQDLNIPDQSEMLIVNDITTINEETDIIETKKSAMIAHPHSTPTNNVFSSSQLPSNNTPDVGEIVKPESEILDLNSYKIDLHQQEIQMNLEIAPPNSTPSDGDIVPITFSSSHLTSNNTPKDVGEITKTETEILDLNSYEKDIVHVEGNQNQYENLRSNQRFRPNKVKKSKPYYCTICKKSFGNYCNLKRHYETIMHKTAVQSDGLPVPAILVMKVGNRYKCDQCPEQFTIKSDFIMHMYVHTGKKPFSCSICGKSFLAKTILNKHKMIHREEKPYKCDQCPKQFCRKSFLTQHMYTHTGEKPFSCSVCGKGFTQKHLLKQHISTHTDDKPYKCYQCPKQFCRKRSIIQHISAHHTGKKSFSCKICDATFTLQTSLIEHKTIHSAKNPLKCDQCSKEFKLKSNLTLHRFLHTGKRPFSCNLCGKAFKYKHHLKGHKITHTKEKPYKCDQCPKQFRQKGSLTYHMYTHTGNKPFTCNICGIGCLTKSKLDTHKIMHSSEKPYKCDQCPKQYARKSNFRDHMNFHIRKFSCSVCGLVFTTESSLMKHNTIPCTKNTYKCDQCPKQFFGKTSLKAHMYVHSGKIPFSCSLCGKGFVRESHLKKHKIIHREGQPYKCDQCPKQYMGESRFKEHMRVHTKKKPVQCSLRRKRFIIKRKPYKCEQCSKRFYQKSTLSCHMYDIHWNETV